MGTDEIRLDNLNLLVTEFGSIAEVARRSGTSEKYLWQLLNGVAFQKTGNKRNVGRVLARKLETGCGKPVGWMDVDHSANNLPPQDAQFLNEIRQDVAQYDVPDHVKQAILTLITSSPRKTGT